MKKSRIVFLICFLLLATSVSAEVELTIEKESSGFDSYVIETSWYRLKMVSEVGGWCTSFKMPKDGKEWIPASPESIEKGGWLFQHNFRGYQRAPDTPAIASREVTVVKDTSREVVLSFRYDRANEPEIVRTMTFSGESPAITVKVEMTNNTSTSLYRGFWPGNLFYTAGEKGNSVYIRPSEHGLNVVRWDPEGKEYKGDETVKMPYEGWTAALNTKTGVGIVWVMDYNYLGTLYNCYAFTTTEWFCDPVPLLKNGGKWETTYYTVPVSGFTSLAYASAYVLSDHKLEETGDGCELVSSFVSSAKGLTDITVSARYRLLKDGEKKEQVLSPIKIPRLSEKPQQFRSPVTFPKDRSIVFDITLSGKTSGGEEHQEKYTYVHEGKDAMRFDLLQSKDIPVFVRTAPKKVKMYPKPSVTFNRKPGCPMLEVRGVGYHRTGVHAAAAFAQIFDIKGSWHKQEWYFGTKVDYFPVSYEEMFEYNLIVLNNVDALCIEDFGREMVKEFVRAGGGLLVFGGFLSLSNGKYHEGQLAEVLPVELSGKPFSVKKVEGANKIRKAGNCSVLKDVSIPRSMECYWMETVQPKEGAVVEQVVGDKPFLVCGEYGEGRVAVIAGSVFGDGKNAFFRNKEWPYILAEVMNWVNHGGRIRFE